MRRETLPPPRRQSWLPLSAPLIAFACISAAWNAAEACSVPVFRYALERWAVDWYELDIFYRGELSTEDGHALEALEDRCLPNGGEANLEVVRVNIDDKLPPDLAELWQASGDVSLPHAVLRMPRGGPNVWSGPLADLGSATLLNSPARREIARRLLAGHSVVWLIVGRKDAAQTGEIRTVLTETLSKLQEEIPLPAGVGLPGSELLSPAPLEVKFSLLEIDPSDEAEPWLMRMLSVRRAAAAIVADKQTADDVRVAAFFGRGRVVDVFRGGEINPEVLADVSQFLCGACSCQVKQLNPGFDLLFATHWEQELFDREPNTATVVNPALADTAEPVRVPIPQGMPVALNTADSADEADPPAPVKSPAGTGSSSGEFLIWSVIGLALVMVLLSLARGSAAHNG